MALSEQGILQRLMSQRDRISAAAWLVVRDAHIAEDIFQNVALKALAKEVAFDSDGALMSWAFITARREGIDWLRRQKNVPVSLDETILELLEAEWASESLGQAGGRSQALRDCLSELPAKSRELLKMRYFDGQLCEEVAASLNTKLDAIYKRDFSAPTGEDKEFKKESMPAVMQVAAGMWGKRGQTKYTHLKDQDTSRRDSPWNNPQRSGGRSRSKEAGQGGRSSKRGGDG